MSIAQSTLPRILRLCVPADKDGVRLDHFLCAASPQLTRARIQALIKEAHVVCEQDVVCEQEKKRPPIIRASQKVHTGQVFALHIPPPVAATPDAQPMDLDIYYEDEHLIVINKPAGLVVHPAAGNPDKTLVNALLAHCGESLSGIGGVMRPGIVHRLDKDTSGLMVVAKHDRAHQGLATLFARHDIERVYHAFIRGVMRPRAGTIDGNIGRNPRNRKKMAVLATGGKPARTHYTTCKTYADRASLVHCRLESGRTHQIRVHLSAYKHPILADALYGRVGMLNNTLATRWCMAGESEPLTQALHAAVLGFKHPISGKAMRFDSPPGRLFDFLDATLTQLV